MTTRVVTDSTSDLPPEVARELGIAVVPLYVHFKEAVYKDGVDLTPDDFYGKLQASPQLPTTSAPSPGAFKDVYARLAREADGILSVHISTRLSATCEAARLGSEGLDCPISIIDSRTASMGCGLLAIMAAKAASQGASLSEVDSLVRGAIPRTFFFGMVNTLEYLSKGGRIGKAQALLGTMLSIKPLIGVRDGEVIGIGRVRSRAKAIERILQIVQGMGTIQDLAVMDSTIPQEVEALAQRLSLVFPEKRIYRSKFGPVIGTYLGPGSLGVALIHD